MDRLRKKKVTESVLKINDTRRISSLMSNRIILEKIQLSPKFQSINLLQNTITANEQRQVAFFFFYQKRRLISHRKTPSPARKESIRKSNLEQDTEPLYVIFVNASVEKRIKLLYLISFISKKNIEC